MAEYNITVELLKVTLSSMTAEQIVTALETLTGDDRLDATAIKNLPDGSGVVEMTGDEIVAAVNEDATTQIDYSHITTFPKSRVIHGENSLNWLANVDPRSTAWQNLYKTPNADRIKKMDFVIVAQVYQTTEIFQNGDWLIALADDPGFTYTDTAKWLIMPYSKLPLIQTPIFQRHSTSASAGIESVSGQSSANGEYSFAPGELTQATGRGGTALGIKSKTERIGEVAESSGVFTNPGDAQRKRFVMRKKTTNATPTQMTEPSLYGFEADKTYEIIIHIVAAVRGGKKAKAWDYRYLTGVDSDGYVPVAGGAEEISSGTDGWYLAYGSPAISVNVSVTEFDASGPPSPGVFKGLVITVTGEANTDYYWTAFIETFEVGTL